MNLYPTLWKTITCVVILLLGSGVFLNAKYSHLFVELFGRPFRLIFNRYPHLFLYSDHPYINFNGALIVALFWAIVVYVLWSYIA